MRNRTQVTAQKYISGGTDKHNINVRPELLKNEAEAKQGILPMPELIEADIAYSVLMGAKLADVSVSYGMRYIACREIVHKFCRRANPIAYEILCVEAAHQDNSSPKLGVLQAHRSKFLGSGISVYVRKRITKKALKRELAESRRIMETHQKMFRFERVRQALLMTELGLR